MDELLTTQQVAQKLGVGPTSVKRWADSGRIAYVRTLGGHRRYALAAVLQLHELEAAAAVANVLPTATPPSQLLDLVPSEHWRDPLLTRWLNLVAHFDGAALADELTRAANDVGAVEFLDDYARPFLLAVGQLWAHSRLTIAHEHFASEQMRARLGAMLPPNAISAPTVLCATLRDELHMTGLQMAAVTVRLAGMSVIFFGANLPVAELAKAAADIGARADLRAVLVSVSPACDPDRACSDLNQLRVTLPPSVTLVVGGAGAPEGVVGVDVQHSLRELRRWAREQVLSPPRSL